MGACAAGGFGGSRTCVASAAVQEENSGRRGLDRAGLICPPCPARLPRLRLQGSWSPSAAVPGGTLYYAYPFGQGVPISNVAATLEYDVYFPPDFQFVKGEGAGR